MGCAVGGLVPLVADLCSKECSNLVVFLIRQVA